MVVKRSCSFCAGEIEPGTGTMFIKRDGAVFHFCSSSCRKQQLHLGRVGHRLKWTRAHVVKRQTEQSSAAGKAAGKTKITDRSGAKPTATPTPAKAPSVETPAAPVEGKPAAEPATDKPTEESKPAETTLPPAPPARKPRTKKPKEPDAAA
jgi:large subunit ribosomal protein L24e